jgi:hypothetical protein
MDGYEWWERFARWPLRDRLELLAFEAQLRGPCSLRYLHGWTLKRQRFPETRLFRFKNRDHPNFECGGKLSAF